MDAIGGRAHASTILCTWRGVIDERTVFENHVFDVGDETWVVTLENDLAASANDTDLRVFQLALRKTDGATGLRRLRLLASSAGIQVEDYAPLLRKCVRDFLRTGQETGEVQCF